MWRYNKMDKQGPFLDDVYAYGLSRALIKVAPPATVGLFSNCQSRTEMLLKKIKIYMNREAEWRESKYKESGPRSACLSSSLALLLFIIFLRPVWSEKEEFRRKRVRWIFVRFSAWHYAGSDKLWAGLVIRLFKAIQKHFGELFLSLYRTTQHPYPKRVQTGPQANWKVRKFFCVPLWLVVLIAVAMSAGASLLLYLSGFQIKNNSTFTWATLLESVAIGTLGLPSIITLRFFLNILKNLFYSQGSSILRNMNCTAISDQLGFMNKVRKEVAVLVEFIHFMEVFERRKIRVVLEITNLDRCSPDRVIQTLEAMNILLAGENVPFVSILAVNPSVVVSCVENSVWFRGPQASGYEFLNQIVTLPFSVPEMCTKSKCRVFKTLANSHLEVCTIENESIEAKNGRERMGRGFLLEMGIHNESVVPFLDKSKSESEVLERALTWEIWAKKVKVLTNNALAVVYSKENHLYNYLAGNCMQMRRIINSVRVSVIVMEAVSGGSSSASDIAAWVVLANLWPCRLSWILQCLEDRQQGADIDCTIQTIYHAKHLWEVFSESSLELHTLRDRLESVLQQDGDPELFERFLKIDFRFTVRDVERFKPCTINLDHSIRKELARVKGRSSLRDLTKQKSDRALHVGSIAHMNMDNICKEVKEQSLH